MQIKSDLNINAIPFIGNGKIMKCFCHIFAKCCFVGSGCWFCLARNSQTNLLRITYHQIAITVWEGEDHYNNSEASSWYSSRYKFQMHFTLKRFFLKEKLIRLDALIWSNYFGAFATSRGFKFLFVDGQHFQFMLRGIIWEMLENCNELLVAAGRGLYPRWDPVSGSTPVIPKPVHHRFTSGFTYALLGQH